MNDMEKVNERLADLETRLTFIDNAVDTLGQADTEQSRRLLAMERVIQDLRSELASMRTALNDDAYSEPPPPHY